VHLGGFPRVQLSLFLRVVRRRHRRGEDIPKGSPVHECVYGIFRISDQLHGMFVRVTYVITELRVQPSCAPQFTKKI
jgi:hypothetical protein